MEVTDIIPPSSVKKALPLKEKEHEFLLESRKTIKNILNKKDRRVLAIVGPCSIHHFSSAILFAEELLLLQQSYPQFYFVMRVHVEKPRSGIGWRGFIYDPDLSGHYDMNKGIILSRTLMQSILELRVPISGELLDPFTYPYIADLYSMATIGARSVLSPVNRDLAAKSHFPVGLKNSLDGDPYLLSGAMDVVRSPGTFLSLNDEGKLQKEHTNGNLDSFIILRGTQEGANFSRHHLNGYRKAIKYSHVPFMIDCGHGNSQKKLQVQKENFIKVVEMIAEGEDITGVMLEVFFEEGKQSFSISNPYQSITDPCISLEDLRSLLESAKELLMAKTGLTHFDRSN